LKNNENHTWDWKVRKLENPQTGFQEADGTWWIFSKIVRD
jgi:hypothetical protein